MKDLVTGDCHAIAIGLVLFLMDLPNVELLGLLELDPDAAEANVFVYRWPILYLKYLLTRPDLEIVLEL